MAVAGTRQHILEREGVPQVLRLPIHQVGLLPVLKSHTRSAGPHPDPRLLMMSTAIDNDLHSPLYHDGLISFLVEPAHGRQAACADTYAP